MRLNDAELADVRGDLLARRDELRAHLAGLAARPERGANLSFGKRIGDGTTEAVARLNEIGVVGRSLEASEERIERALAKLAGSYGRCDSCGEPIAPRRATAAAPRQVLVSVSAGRFWKRCFDVLVREPAEQTSASPRSPIPAARRRSGADVKVLDVLENHRPPQMDADGPPTFVHDAHADVLGRILVNLVEQCVETRRR